MKTKSLLLILLFLGINYTTNAQTFNETQGTHSGISITTGDYSAMFGDSTGSNVTSGSRLTLFGYGAGRSMTTQSELIAIGYLAGYSNTSGFDNSFIGYEAGRLTTTGGDNTFFGAESGENNTTGYDNTFMGEESGTNNTTGYENVFIGEDAGFSNTTGYRNTFIGNEAGISSGTGFRNTGVGDEALSDVAEGHHNSAFGDSAGIDVNRGYYNTFIGAASGVATEYADYNTFVGARSGWDNNRTNNTTNANRNTYVGFEAGFTNREGQDNVGMGAYADYDNNNRSRNTFIGAYSVPSENDVIMMGYSGFNDGRYSISIGQNHDVRGTNSVVLGNLADTEALSDYSVGIGDAVDLDNVRTTVIGAATKGQIDGGIALGYGAIVDKTTNINALENIALGYLAKSTDSVSVAIGNRAIASASNAFVIGNNITNTTANSMLLGGADIPVSVGIGTNAPNAKASLELADTNKGFLINRVTNGQKTILEGTLLAGDIGLMVYDTDDKVLYVWDGTAWTSSTLGNLETRVANLETAAQAAATDKTPQKFNYQTSLLDVNGEPILNQSVNFRISILETTASGASVYQETHNPTTTNKGLTSFKIGDGTVVSGDFTTVDWAADEYFLKIEADVSGGTTYQDFGTTQLISVPYALHAKTADKLTGNLSGALAKSTEKQNLVNASLKQEVENLKKTVESLLKLIAEKK